MTLPFPRIIGLCLILSLAACGQLSSEQEKLIFETSQFAEPISTRLPNQSSKEFYESVRANPTIRQQGMNISLRIGGSEIKDFNPKLMAFLGKEDYLTWEKLSQTTISRYGQNTKQHEFFFYQDKLEPHKVSKNDMLSGASNHIKLGHRKLISINHKQTSKVSGNEVLNIAFTYSIVSELPELASPDKILEGTAEAYLSREDGKWHLGSIHLARGESVELIQMMNP